jgi:hypothetical protein
MKQPSFEDELKSLGVGNEEDEPDYYEDDIDMESEEV